MHLQVTGHARHTKSLAVDFRPPSAVTKRGGTVGPYYNDILSNVSNVLGNLATEFPAYDGGGYEIVGFGWHQGWNDRVTQSYNDEYEANMADFINDIRDDLGTADLPFVIATTSMGGDAAFEPNIYGGRPLSLEQAQLAMADTDEYPEFEGNVSVVWTRDFWRESSVSPSGQDYHWNQNGESYYLIGDSMGEAMTELIVPEPTTLALLGVGGLALWRRRR